MLLGDYVFHVKSKKVFVLMESAIFATVGSPPPDQSASCGIHYEVRELANSNRAFDLSIATKVPNET